MVRPGARSDNDLGAVTDRTGRVERRAVTSSSRGVRGRYSTSDIPSTSAPIAPGIYYDPGAPGSSTQSPSIPFTTHPPPTISYHPYTPVPYDPYGYSQPPQTSYDPYAYAPSLPIRMPGLDPTQHFSRTQIPLNDISGPGLQLGAKFFEQLAGSVPIDSSYSGAEYGATAHGIFSSDVGLVMSKIAGSRQKRPEKSRPPTNPTQRKKSKNDTGARLCKPYIQRFAMLGHKTENKLIDLRIRLDTMTADEVRWIPYRFDEISDSPICPIGLSDSLGGFNTFQLILFVLRSTTGQQITGLPRGVQIPTIAPIKPQVLLDMAARELDRDDIDDATKVSRASDMIKRYHQTRR
ncbi:hypothetical protein M9H77_12266 [Catharanthus roseus]|uniref:Uncharacterized protein n=1 Tax=Catharanthus roseus TaxID=4058 RepID=A0ACC0BGW9_CATRO|nr:hypothetical protein M9H77_12266 [Catharanthus roseus]